MITFEIGENNLFKVRLFDTVTFNDIKIFLQAFKELNDMPKKITLLYDMVDVDLAMTVEEIQLVSKLANLATSNYQSVRTAFLVDKPKESAYLMLFNEFEGNPRSERRIFSTLPAALAWLDN